MDQSTKERFANQRIQRMQKHQRYWLILTSEYLIDSEHDRLTNTKIRWSTPISAIISAAIEPDWHGGVSKIAIHTSNGEKKTFKQVALVKGLALGPGMSHVGNHPWATMEAAINQAREKSLSGSSSVQQPARPATGTCRMDGCSEPVGRRADDATKWSNYCDRHKAPAPGVKGAQSGCGSVLALLCLVLVGMVVLL